MKRQSLLERKVVAAVAFALVVGAAQPSDGANITWNTAVSDGLFSSGTNWGGGVPPAESDTAIFANTGSLNVEFSGDATVANFTYDGSGSVMNPAVLTLDLNGYELHVNGSVRMLSDSAKGARTIVVDDGTFSVHQLQIGNSSSGTPVSSQIHVQNGGLLEARSTVRIGNDRPGELVIDSGAQFKTANRVSLGFSSAGIGTVSISGANSKWTTTGASAPFSNDVVSVGALGSGAMSVTDGGAFEGQVLQLGRNNANNDVAASYIGNGTLTVSGEGSAVSAQQFYLGGGRAGYDSANPALYPAIGDGNGTATFSDGATGSFGTLRAFRTEGTVSGNPVETKGALIIDDATVSVTADATFDSFSDLTLELNSPSQDLALAVGGLLTVADANLLLTLDDSFSATAGDSFSLISYSTLAGTFNGFADLSTFTMSGYEFQIDYTLGDSNVIGLVVVPEPQTNLMIGTGLALLGYGAFRRGRRSATLQG